MPYSLDSEQNTLFYDLIKVSISSVEIIFLKNCLKSQNNFNENESGIKVLSISLIWAFFDAICLYLFYFIINSTGEEFTWEYIQTAILSNVEMVEKISIVALIESIDKISQDKKFNIHLIFVILLRYVFNGIGFKYIEYLQKIKDWDYILLKIAIALCFGFISKLFFNYYNKTEEQRAEEEFYREKYKKNN